MISILITAYKEPDTIGKAIEAFLNEKIKDSEILVAAPDDETLAVVNKYAKRYHQVKSFKDSGNGKPAALNLLLSNAKGEILVLSDGDVYINQDSVQKLLKHFDDAKIGAVSARPLSINPKDNMLGYWSHLLTDAGAHNARLARASSGKFIVCTGYLYAIRNIIEKVPEDALADDAVISYMIWNKGYKIGYEPEAIVYVKYPANFNDWMLQKTRSAGGYTQLKKYFGSNFPRMRSFGREVFFGWYRALSYAKTPKEFYWTIMLFFARLYLWLNIFIKLKIMGKSFAETWKRVESTK
ncbi:glycosyltransferase [Candidatus Woesearchaeota archaeon]|nr:glycosyltransferase [Candidatus Woesearchaeota archaeon]